jgi:hypothetical protein
VRTVELSLSPIPRKPTGSSRNIEKEDQGRPGAKGSQEHGPQLHGNGSEKGNPHLHRSLIVLDRGDHEPHKGENEKKTQKCFSSHLGS